MPVSALILSLLLFPAILLCLELGHRLSARGMPGHESDMPPGFSVIDGSVFSLLGLLLAFSFSAAGSRFEQRRQLVVGEAAAIRDTFIRVDILPTAARDRLHTLIVDYANVRRAYNQDLHDHADPERLYKASVSAQQGIWQAAIDLSRQPKLASDMRLLVIPALSLMFKTAEDRHVAAMSREPALIYGLLTVLSLLGGVLAGRLLTGPRGPQRAHRIIFASIIAATVFVICDLDNPRVGLIRVDYVDRMFEDVSSRR